VSKYGQAYSIAFVKECWRGSCRLLMRRSHCLLLILPHWESALRRQSTCALPRAAIATSVEKRFDSPRSLLRSYKIYCLQSSIYNSCRITLSQICSELLHGALRRQSGGRQNPWDNQKHSTSTPSMSPRRKALRNEVS
jgi:hypothetical protein